MKEEPVTYDASSGLYYVDIPLDRPDSVADAVVFSVAEILDQDPLSLPPLGQVVDTDSLANIFRSTGSSQSDASISFAYSGFVVTVQSSGRISFEESI